MQPGRAAGGSALVRVLAAIALTGIVLAASMSGLRAFAAHAEVRGAARVVRAHLGYARTLAVARREVVELRLNPGGELIITDSQDSLLRRTRLRGGDGFRLDSARLRPGVLRFNSRGQGAPGSAYLYRGTARVRLVVNFLGRVREERLP